MKTTRKIGRIQTCEIARWKLYETFGTENFSTIDASLMTEWKVFETLGTYTKELHLLAETFITENSLNAFLKSMPNLEIVTFVNVCLKHYDGNVHISELPNFSRLTTLEFKRSQLNLLNLFMKARITTLRVSRDYNESSDKTFFGFLAGQTNLESLAIRFARGHYSPLFRNQINTEMIHFKLKKLSLLTFRLEESPDDHYNLLEFMNLHCETLEELEIGFWFPDFIFGTIFTKFKSLKLLRVKAAALPKEKEFYDRLKENKSIKTLVLSRASRTTEFESLEIEPEDEITNPVQGLIAHLPNIERLVLQVEIKHSTLEFVANNLPHLKCLEVDTYREDLFAGLRFSQSLSILRIRVMDSFNIEAFTVANPNISELSIQTIWYENHDNFTIDAMTRNWKLQSLRIEAYSYSFIKFDMKFFDIIRQNCKDLRNLELNVKHFTGDISEVADIRGLRFRSEDRQAFTNIDDGKFWSADDESYDY